MSSHEGSTSVDLETLKENVRNIIKEGDLNMLTAKMIRKELEQRLKISLRAQKAYVAGLVEEQIEILRNQTEDLNEAIVQGIKKILSEGDLSDLTNKKIRILLEKDIGVSLKSQKKAVNALISRELAAINSASSKNVAAENHSRGVSTSYEGKEGVGDKQLCSDTLLREKIRHVLEKGDLLVLTKKTIRTMIEDDIGVSLVHQKKKIGCLITEEIDAIRSREKKTEESGLNELDLEMDDEEEQENEAREVPSENTATIRDTIRLILEEGDLNVLTTKSVRNELKGRLGISLKGRKKEISEIITEEMEKLSFLEDQPTGGKDTAVAMEEDDQVGRSIDEIKDSPRGSRKGKKKKRRLRRLRRLRENVPDITVDPRRRRKRGEDEHGDEEMQKALAELKRLRQRSSKTQSTQPNDESVESPSTEARSEVSESIESFLKLLFDEDLIQKQAQEIGFRDNNFEKFSRKEAFSTLKKIQESTTMNEKSAEDLATEFFKYMPERYQRELKEPVSDSPSSIRFWSSTVEKLSYIEEAKSSIKLCEERKRRRRKKQNRVDILYKSLGVKLKDLESSSKLGVALNHLVTKVSGPKYSVRIEHAFSLKDYTGRKKFQAFKDLENHKLLLKVYPVAAGASLLKQGIRFKPKECPTTGNFGKGMRLSDTLEGAIHMANATNKNFKYLLVFCRVALGKVFEMNDKTQNIVRPPIPYHSVMQRGKATPIFDGEILKESGISMPTVKMEEFSEGKEAHNTYFVYDHSQVLQKYMCVIHIDDQE